MTGNLEWQFGGWLRAWPAAVAWLTLVALALAGCGLVRWLYRRTLRDLSPGARTTLTILRGFVFLALLLCLANPMRVARTPPSKPERTLAVVVDRSASMSQPDRRGTTRLATALRIWKSHEAGAAGAFSRVNHYRFAQSLSPVANLNDAVAKESGAETHLYSALRELLPENPAAIVCLTDGLDTTAETFDALIAEARQRGVPLNFVVGNNRVPTRSGMLRIREVKAPESIARRTRFIVSTVVEVVSERERELPVELWSGEKLLVSAQLPVRAGLNTLPWSAAVAAGEAGLMPLEVRAGTGEEQQIAARATRVVETTALEVLYYQGALQWGGGFLRDALESDPGFRVTAVLNPALGMKASTAAADGPMLLDLPNDTAGLKRFQVVMLANVFADQLSAAQQRALMDYTRGGGGVLFISPDTAATRAFSGTPLEEMLPVVFESPLVVARDDSAERRFQDIMRSIGGADNSMDANFAAATLRRQDAEPLTTFAAAEGRGAKLFQAGDDSPRFLSYAKVRRVKAGAEIIATHPRDRTPGDNQPRPLTARQIFGEGHTAVLNTDLLWRWKLSVPSASRVVETFWQQFVLSLVPPVSKQAMQLAGVGDSAGLNHPIAIQVTGPNDSTAPRVMAVSPAGVATPMQLTALPATNGLLWQGGFTPDAKGRWEVRAAGADGATARMTLTVSEAARSVELLHLAADAEGLRRVAEATGGRLIADDARVFHAPPAVRTAGWELRPPHPFWNRSWLLVILLGAYCTELIVRRRCRLL